jgi:small subunit ribosomal protein S1
MSDEKQVPEYAGPDLSAEDAETPAPARRDNGAPPSGVLMNLDEEDGDASSKMEVVGLYLESMKSLQEGEIVHGTILRVDEKEVLVDIGFKSEGVIPIEEFADQDSIRVGDPIEVYLEKMENQDGLVVLSKQRADFVKVWDRVKDAADKSEVVNGRILRKIKGGAVVDLFGVEAFLPGSQIALRQMPNIDSLMGQTLQFRIIKLNKRRRNIVVSRRVVLEEERDRMKGEVLKDLQEGQIREGVVKNITDFGAFVDLGGIDGLLHITDMSWGRVSHPSEVVSIGDRVKVKVLSFDPERERISLGLKQLTPYPWENVDQKYQVGQRVKGKVVSITDYGAFVELEKGVEGLVHISEMSWTKHVRHPSKVVSIGDVIEAQVLKVDKENEKISLGLKQTEPDPWLTLDEKYPVGLVLNGKVRNLTNFGAFVELEEGIDGLVHISDMSWTRRVNHPSEVVKKGDKVEVKILAVDKENRRISLGLKQVEEDPWPTLAEEFRAGSQVTGVVTRLLDKGAIVELERGIEGFIPISQLGIESLKRPSDSFRPGDELMLKVTRVDPQNHRIVLSAKAFLSEQDEEALEAFRKKFSDRPPLPEGEAEGGETPRKGGRDLEMDADLGEEAASDTDPEGADEEAEEE